MALSGCAVNWLDGIVVIVVLVLGLIGWKTGIIRAVVALGGTAVGLFLAGQYYDDLGEQLESVIENPDGARVAGFVIIFLTIFVGAIIAGRLLRSVLRQLYLSWVDNAAGSAVGAFVGVALCTGLAVVLAVFPFGNLDKTVEDSLFGDFLVDNFTAVRTLLPEEFDKTRNVVP